MNEYEILIKEINPCGGEAHARSSVIEAEAESPKAYVKDNGRFPIMKQKVKKLSVFFMVSTILIFHSVMVYASESKASEVSVDTNMIKEIQILLNKSGYDCGTADGVLGPKTSAAITSYKKDNGMDETNLIDQEFLDNLDGIEPQIYDDGLPRASDLKKAEILQKYKGVYAHITENGDTDDKFLVLTDTEMIHYDFVNEGVRLSTKYSDYMNYYQIDGEIYMLESGYANNYRNHIYIYSLYEKGGEKYIKEPDLAVTGDIYVFTSDYTAEDLADHYNTSPWSYEAYSARRSNSSDYSSNSALDNSSGSSSGSSSNVSSNSSSGKSSGSSSKKKYDPYGVYDYDDGDEFAAEWAEEFGDGDYEDGYDEAYDYWEYNNSLK